MTKEELAKELHQANKNLTKRGREIERLLDDVKQAERLRKDAEDALDEARTALRAGDTDEHS